nr:PREDICTED: uncharacterized protein LOC109030657 [Bemisia tabaci]
MLTQSEYAIRMMEMRGKVSLLETLVAYRECRTPLRPRCLFGPSDKKENITFAKTELMKDRQKFFQRYALVEPHGEDLLFELCNSVKRKRKWEDDRIQTKVPCTCALEAQEQETSPIKQTHITDFWQIKRRQVDSSPQKTQSLPPSTVSLSHPVDSVSAV